MSNISQMHDDLKPATDSEGYGITQAEFDRLKAVNAELVAALDKCLQLVAKGAAEHAYDNMVAGPEYAERVFQNARAALSKARAS